MRNLLFLLIFSACSPDGYDTVFTHSIRGTSVCSGARKTFNAEVLINKQQISVNNELLKTVKYDFYPNGVTTYWIGELQETTYCSVIWITEENDTITGLYTIAQQGTLHPLVGSCFNDYTFEGQR